jgi:hypothetical protein
MPSLRVRKAADLLPSTTLTGHFSCCCFPRRIDQSRPFWSSSGSRRLGKIWLSYYFNWLVPRAAPPKGRWIAQSWPSRALAGAGDNDVRGCRNGRTAHRKTDHQRSSCERKADQATLIEWAFPIARNCQIGKSGGSFTSFSRIQNPRPVSECYINPFLAESRAKLNRKFVQHRLDCLVGQMAEIGVDGFPCE